MERKRENVTVRTFIEEDIPSKIKMINDVKNNSFLHYALPLNERKTLEWFNRIKKSDDRLDLTILYNGRMAGVIGLLSIDYKNRKAEYYICVDSSFSRKGIGLISTDLLLEYAFGEMQLNKVYLYTETGNKKAQHLFEKMGFLREGLLRDDIIYDGKKVSRYAYGICKEDYDAKNTNS